MARDLPWRKAIEKVLGSAEGAMHYKDIAEQIVSDGLRENVGATPASTVNVALNDTIKKYGDKSPFENNNNKGEYILRSKSKEIRNQPQLDDSSSSKREQSGEKSEEQYEVISSFGMFWRRDFVDWSNHAKLLGMQQLGAESVDFNKQLGIYLLYDGREIIYVGRSTARPLGQRLYEHTADRLSTRWDRFSWFGLLPVSDKGNFGSLPSKYAGTNIIPALEAILLEALEPRQNRKRGDDLAAVEYLQKEDPKIERKKIKSLLESALSKV